VGEQFGPIRAPRRLRDSSLVRARCATQTRRIAAGRFPSPAGRLDFQPLANGPLPRLALRRDELVDDDRPVGESGQNLQFAAEGFDNFSQRRNLHVDLLFEFRQARLLHSQQIGDLLLAHARQVPHLAEEQFAEQLLSTARCFRLGFLRGRPFNEVVK
jgi:hypothetical protein